MSVPLNVQRFYVSLDQPASSALRTSLTDNTVAPKQEFVVNDILEGRIYFSRQNSAGVLYGVALESGTDLYLAGTGSSGGAALFSEDSFTKVENAASTAADDASITLTDGLADGDTIELSDASGTTETFEAYITGSPAAGHTGFTAVVTGFTATASDDLVRKTSHGFVADEKVEFLVLTGGTGLALSTIYFVLAAGLTANAFAVSLTSGGAAVNILTDYSAITIRPRSISKWAAAVTAAVNASTIGMTATNASPNVTLVQDTAGEDGNTTIVINSGNITLGSSFTDGTNAEVYYTGVINCESTDFKTYVGSSSEKDISIQIQVSDAIGAATKRRTVARFTASGIRDDADDNNTPTITPTPHYIRLLSVQPSVDANGNGPGNIGEGYTDGHYRWECYATNKWSYWPINTSFPPA